MLIEVLTNILVVCSMQAILSIATAMSALLRAMREYGLLLGKEK